LCSSFSAAPPPPSISPLSLHDALPICLQISARLPPPSSTSQRRSGSPRRIPGTALRRRVALPKFCERYHRSLPSAPNDASPVRRSEEHTSELQSRENLVCRLLLEKKKQ